MFKRLALALLLILFVSTSQAQNFGFVPSGAPPAATPAYVYAELPAETNTTITVGGTYYPISGPFTNVPLVGFELEIDHLVYIGLETKWFIVTYNATAQDDNAGEHVHVGVSINSAAPVGIMGTLCKFADEPYPFSGVCMVLLSTGDEVQLVVTADSSGNVITMKHFTTIITSVGG